MSIYMTRNPNQGKASSTASYNPKNEYQFYTAAYAAGTSQEAIYLPDINGGDVTISFDSAGSARCEGTGSAPDLIEAGTAVWYDWPAGDITVTTNYWVKPPTAIRLYRTSGTPRITVRV